MEYILQVKKKEAEDVCSLCYESSSGSKLKFTPGQFVSVKPLLDQISAKPYTISSLPEEDWLCLTIKRQGTTSAALIDMEIGQKVSIIGPFGHFSPSVEAKDLVMIAGGIGITPFFNVIKKRLESGDTNIVLFYSNKKYEGIIYRKELEELSKRSKNFNFVNFLTQEVKLNHNDERGRITVDSFKKHIKDFDGKHWHICGSIQFVNDTWQMLKTLGVEEKNIFTEAFY